MMYKRSLGWIGLTSLVLWNSSALALTSIQLLPPQVVADEMAGLPGWITDGQQISCTYEFENFVEAIAFVNRLVEPAETVGHHPDLLIQYNRVTVSLTTHDAGGLTTLDFAVARQLDPCQ